MIDTIAIKLRRACVWALALGVLIPALRLQAREMSEKEVVAAVETWVRNVPAQSRPDAVIEKLEPYREDGKTVAYIAHLAGGGYCLCGADDQCLPVYLYNPVNHYDPADPDMPYLLHSIPEHRLRLEAERAAQTPQFQQYAPRLSARQADWQTLGRRAVPIHVSLLDPNPSAPSLIALPANSWWHQGSPFNQACPALPPGGTAHCFVGCVGTAASQIMYYWRWPNTGEGEHTVAYNYRSNATWLAEPLATDPSIPSSWAGLLEWRADNGGELRMKGDWDWSMYGVAWRLLEDQAYRTALENLWADMPQLSQNVTVNPGTTTYQWNLMLDDYVGVALTDPATVAVMNLCRDAAVASDMGFGIWGSSSSIGESREALIDSFRYDPDIVRLDRDTNVMIEEIQWLRPVQLAGGDGLGAGHSWMTCGYDTGPEPDLFLVNRGQGGGTTDWLGVDDYWSSGQSHLTMIAPEGVVRFVGNTVSGDGSPNSPFQNVAAALSTVDDGTTLIFKAGTTNTFSTTSLTIDRPMTLKGCQATIQRQ